MHIYKRFIISMDEAWQTRFYSAKSSIIDSLKTY